MKKILSAVMCLMLAMTPVLAGAADDKAVQIVNWGASVPAGWYDAGTHTYDNAKIQLNADGVAISKTIEKTAYENHFDITLKVATEHTYEKLIQAPSTDVVIVMDKSRTMQSNTLAGTTTTRLTAAKDAAKAFIDAYDQKFSIDDNNRLAFVTFDSNAETVIALDNDLSPQQMKDTVGAIATRAADDPERFTNIEGGLQLAKNLLADSTAIHKYVVFISDGMPTTYIEKNAGSKTKINGYDVYQGGSYTGSTAAGYFADRVNKLTCSAGVDYSDEAAKRAQDVAAELRNNVNVFSIGIDIGSQTVWNYVARHLGKEFSTVDRYAGQSHYVIGEPVVASPKSLHPGSDYAGYYINWLTEEISGGPEYPDGLYFDGSSTNNLGSAFANILDEIESINEKDIVNTWAVSDPMGSLIEFDGFYNQQGKLDTDGMTGSNAQGKENTVSFTNNAINWKVFSSGYTKTELNGKELYIYELKYRVRLKNELNTFKESDEIDTNGTTTVKYKVAENGKLSSEKTLTFPMPVIQGYLGELSFTKIDDFTNKPIPGVQFTLRHNHDCPVCVGGLDQTIKPNPSEHRPYNIVSIKDVVKYSDAEGKVSFTNIPSGHEYTLYEQVPHGYGEMTEDHEWDVVVAYNVTSIEENDQTTGSLKDGSLTIINTPQHQMTHLRFKATKVLEHVHGFDAGKFGFELALSAVTGSDANKISFGADNLHDFTKPEHTAEVVCAASSSSASASAEIKFPLIHVKEPGTYILSVKEKVGDDSRIEYTPQSYEVKFKVEQGHIHENPTSFILKVTEIWVKTCTPDPSDKEEFVLITKPKSGTSDTHALVNEKLVFTNTHKTRSFSFDKKDSDTLKGIGGVEFVLSHAAECSCGYEIDPYSVKTDADGKVTFSGIPVGHNYVMSETIPAGYEDAETKPYKVVVPASEPVTIDGASAEAVYNTPEYMPAQLRLGGFKTVSDVQDFAAEQYSFTLSLKEKPDGAVVRHSAANNGEMTSLTVMNGNVDVDNANVFVFPDLYFSEIGEYVLKMVENKPADEHVVHDTSEYLIYVTVAQGALFEKDDLFRLDCTYRLEKNGEAVTFADGKTETDDFFTFFGSVEFSNTLTRSGFEIKKVSQYDQRVLPGAAFSLVHVHQLDDGTSSMEGYEPCCASYEFAPISVVTDAYGHAAFEQVAQGHTYYLIETNAPESYDPIENAIVVEMKADGVYLDGEKLTEAAVIENRPTYWPVDLEVTAQKLLDGKVTDMVFNFVMEDEDGNVIAEVENQKDLIEFVTLTFEEAGTYTFTLKEGAGKRPGMIYDLREFTLTVTVEETVDEAGNGWLTATPVYTVDGKPCQDNTAVFENFNMPPETGDNSRLILWQMLLISALCLMAILMRRRVNG